MLTWRLAVSTSAGGGGLAWFCKELQNVYTLVLTGKISSRCQIHGFGGRQICCSSINMTLPSSNSRTLHLEVNCSQFGYVNHDVRVRHVTHTTHQHPSYIGVYLPSKHGCPCTLPHSMLSAGRSCPLHSFCTHGPA